MPDWIKTIASFAPGLATALGGPLAGLAATMATRALGLADGDADGLQQAVMSGDPEILLKLKQADQDFQIQLKNLDVDITRIEAADRDSARQREAVTGDSWTPRILAATVVGGWIGISFFIMQNGLAGEMVVRLAATVDTALILVLSYYFGASHRQPVPKKGV